MQRFPLSEGEEKEEGAGLSSSPALFLFHFELFFFFQWCGKDSAEGAELVVCPGQTATALSVGVDSPQLFFLRKVKAA